MQVADSVDDDENEEEPLLRRLQGSGFREVGFQDLWDLEFEV